MQVKYVESAIQHWTIANICEATSNSAIESSILVKLFRSYDENLSCQYRLLVNEGVNRDLRLFAYRWHEAEPSVDLGAPQLAEIREKLQRWSPPAGTTLDDFLEHFAIELHPNSLEEFEQLLLVDLLKYLNSVGIKALIDEVEIVLIRLHSIIYKSGSPPVAVSNRGISTISLRDIKSHILDLSQIRAIEIEAGSHNGPSETLELILKSIGLPQGFIEQASSLRRDYYAEWRLTKDQDQRELLESVVDELRVLTMSKWLQYLQDSTMSELQLFQRCLNGIDEFRLGGHSRYSTLSSAQIYGAFYFMLARHNMKFER